MRDFTVRELHVVWEIFENKYEISTKGGGGWGVVCTAKQCKFIHFFGQQKWGRSRYESARFALFCPVPQHQFQQLAGPSTCPPLIQSYKLCPLLLSINKNLETSRKRFFVPPSGAEHQSNPNLNNLLVHGELQSVFNIKNP